MKQLLNLLAVVLVITGCSQTQLTINDGFNHVDPFIGTDNDHGQTDPAAGIPFGMVKPGPDTKPIGHSGYNYSAKEIIGFSQNRFSGVGCRGTGGNLRMLPDIDNDGEWLAGISYIKNSEVATPGYYHVKLNNGITCELTSSRQVAVHKYTYPSSRNSYLTINLNSTFHGEVIEEHEISNNIITGILQAETVCLEGKYQIC